MKNKKDFSLLLLSGNDPVVLWHGIVAKKTGIGNIVHKTVMIFEQCETSFLISKMSTTDEPAQ